MVKVELLKELNNGIRFYALENESLKLVVVNMGCRIMEILAPDASGKKSDVILGLKNIEDYANLLYDQALLIAGLNIKDPVKYTERITNLMLKSMNNK